ncbi:MAG: acetate kinase [Deltaproteobacteria bacterium]|nr:acetate kinase [Deltaproteobacteria bacterium]
MPAPHKFTVLVINSGSSSVKFTLFGIEDETVLAKGVVERIGLDGTQITYAAHHGEKVTRAVAVGNVREAVSRIIECLADKKSGVLENRKAVAAIGHRVVHGGEKIHAPVVVDEKVKSIIREYASLAPLHNPPNLEGIEACESNFPDTAQVAVFDTAFHASLPEKAYLYGLPYNLYREDKIRRYGFHGTSHDYVSREAARYLGSSSADLKMVTCHLGNGSSITAVDGGRSVDTSMGLTPLEGTVMGTRCGTIDPAIVTHLMMHKGLTVDQVDTLLNKQSGFLGMAGIGSGDVRDVLAAMQKGEARAIAAINVFVHQIRKYLGAYAAVMNGLDTVVFTGGVGENAAVIREMVCNGDKGLDWLGIRLDPKKNSSDSRALREIQSDGNRVAILVIPTDEEKEIARQTMALIGISK